jgi:hypothetical protein
MKNAVLSIVAVSALALSGYNTFALRAGEKAPAAIAHVDNTAQKEIVPFGMFRKGASLLSADAALSPYLLASGWQVTQEAGDRFTPRCETLEYLPNYNRVDREGNILTFGDPSWGGVKRLACQARVHDGKFGNIYRYEEDIKKSPVVVNDIIIAQRKERGKKG